MARYFHQYVCGDVAANVRAPVNNAVGGALSNDSDSNEGWLDRYNSNLLVVNSLDNVSVCDWLVTCINRFA